MTDREPLRYDDALKLLAKAAQWTLKDTEHDPDSALWEASGRLVAARDVVRAGKDEKP